MHYDAKMENIGVPKTFVLEPGHEGDMVEGVSTLGVPGKLCDSPYCTKLVIDQRSREVHHSGADIPESDVPTTFALIKVAAEHFDPIHRN